MVSEKELIFQLLKEAVTTEESLKRYWKLSNPSVAPVQQTAAVSTNVASALVAAKWLWIS